MYVGDVSLPWIDTHVSKYIFYQYINSPCIYPKFLADLIKIINISIVIFMQKSVKKRMSDI